MVREGIDNLGTSEDVKSNENDVVGQQHEARELIGKSVLAKNIIPKVTCQKSISSHKFKIRDNLQISLIWGFFMIYLCMVMEVTQNRIPAPIMVIIPGTHPKTLNDQV